MLAMALMAVLSLQAQAGQSPVMSYDQAVRCSGLTQAASELEGGESAEGRSLYDAALYWSLTVIQVAEASRRAPAQVDADQTRARVRAVRELTAEDATARSELQRCRARAPNLG